MALLRQARRSPGALGLSLRAEPLRRTFWTVSAWTDQEAVNAYASAEPHRSAMRAKRKVMRESTFVFWNVPASDLPITWDEVERRIAEKRGESGERAGNQPSR
jgi:heme-degrading monooxygenase HmoA